MMAKQKIGDKAQMAHKIWVKYTSPHTTAKSKINTINMVCTSDSAFFIKYSLA